MESVRQQLRSINSDIASLTSEIARWTVRPAWTFRDAPDMRVVETLSKQSPHDRAYADRSIEWITKRANEVSELESTTRDLLLATSEITSALENIKLQRSVRWLTWILVGIGLVTAIVAGIAAAHDLGWVFAAASPRP